MDLCASIDEAIPLTLDVCLLEFQASNPAIYMLQILLIFAEFFLWRLQINNIILSCKSSDSCFVILEFSLLIWYPSFKTLVSFHWHCQFLMPCKLFLPIPPIKESNRWKCYSMIPKRIPFGPLQLLLVMEINLHREPGIQ